MQHFREDDSVPVADAESRFVVLLKFDLVGSTAISHALSAPDELDLQRAYRGAVERLIQADHLKLEWEGDGGLVVVGYREARLDAAEIAVRTGLSLIQAVRSITAVPRVRLDVRVGIASGRVTIDKTRDQLSRVKPVSRAARLMEYAQPGQLLVSEDTRRLVEDFFEYEDLGDVDLPGAGPRRVWRVVRETGVVSRFAARRLHESPHEIVGRDAILSRLSAGWSGVLDGRGTAICLLGDSGMGKSRLARAALQQAQAAPPRSEWAAMAPAAVLEIDCTPSTGNSPLLPIGVLLRRIAGIRAGATDADKERAATSLLTRVLGESEASDGLVYLSPLFGIDTAAIPLDKTREQVHAAMITTIVAMVRQLAAQAPLAILCEDLHWADATTARVVQAIAEIVHTLRVMLIVTRWPKPVTPIDFDSITAAFTTIPIEPLSAVTAGHLVRAVAGEELQVDRVDDIVGRCGGVPLLLEEVTRAAVENATAGAALRPNTSDSGVPPELQLVVESRLEQWPELRTIVEAASVLGREFPVSLLQAIVPRGSDVAGALSRFADHGLFSQPDERGDERARFRHALLRDAVYETLVSKDYLRRLHSRAAEALIRQFQGTPDASPDILAQHLRVAERFDEAIQIRLRAGEDTFNRGAYIEAMGHCQDAQALVEEGGGKAGMKKAAFQLCVLLGMVGTGVHGYSAEPAELAYREAHGMFDDEANADARYPVIRGLATAALVRGDLETAHGHSLEGLALAERTQRPDFRIDAMSVLAYTTLYFGLLEDCRSWIEKCLELYDAERGETLRYPVPQDAKTAALALLPTAAWLLGDAQGAEDAIARGLLHVETLGRDFDKALLHGWTAGTRYTQRRYHDALRHAAIAYTIGREQKFEEWEGIGAMMSCISRSALAPAPEAIAQAVALAHAFRARGIGLNGPYFLWGIARGYITAGDHAAAAAVLSGALDVAAAGQETRMNPELWILQAEIEPDQSKAFGLLLDAFRLAERQGAVANALRAAAILVKTRGDDAAAEWARATLALLDGSTPYPDRSRWMHDGLATAGNIVSDLEQAGPGRPR